MKFFKSTIQIVALVCSIQWSISAQSVVLCDKYDSYGTPTGIHHDWDIEESGGYVYILYQQPTVISATNSWYLYIDKDWNNTNVYSAYNTIELNPETGKSWLVYDYQLTEAGKYKVSIQKNQESQAEFYFDVAIKNKTGSAAPAISGSGDKIDTYYYENSLIQFCSSLDENKKPLDIKSTFHLGRTHNATVTIYTTNNEKPVKTNSIEVVISSYGAEIKELKRYSISVQPDWDFFYFKHEFNEAGKYIIDLYSGEDNFINTSETLTITE